MANTTRRRVKLKGRQHGRAGRPRLPRAIELLESRTLLSGGDNLHLHSVSITLGDGHVLEFSDTGALLSAPVGHAGGLLHDEIDSVTLKFSEQVRSRSVTPDQLTLVSDHLGGADPLRVTGVQVGTSNGRRIERGTQDTVTFDLAGRLASDGDAVADNLRLGLSGIQARRRPREPMADWAGVFGVADSGPADPPPQVVGVSPSLGSVWTTLPSTVSIVFNEPLDAASYDLMNYRIVRTGGDGSFGDANDRPSHPTATTWLPASRTLVLSMPTNMPDDRYRLRVGETGGIHDLSGTLFDGNHDGLPGGFFERTFDISTFVPDPPPTIVGVSPLRGAVRRDVPENLVITFSEDVLPSSAASPNFRLVASGSDGFFVDGNEQPVSLSGIAYDSVRHQIVIPLPPTMGDDLYRLRVGDTAGIFDRSGNRLDGDGDRLPGGVYETTFRIDTTPPVVSLSLSSGTDTGVHRDGLTKNPHNAGFLVQVDDGALAAPVGYTVELDLDGDGSFNDGDGPSTTDIHGTGLVTANRDLPASGSQFATVRVTDAAGNSAFSQIEIRIDQSPLALVGSPAAFRQGPAPASIRLTFNDDVPERAATDLANYQLIRSGGDGLFANAVVDATSSITGSRYNAATREVELSLDSSLPADVYRLVAKQRSGLTDAAGNTLVSDGVVTFRVGDSPLEGVIGDGSGPIDVGSLNEFPVVSVAAYETLSLAGLAQNQLHSRLLRRTSSSVTLINVPEAEPTGGPGNPNGNIAGCEQLRSGVTFFGVDPLEDPTVVVTGNDFGLTDTDFYCFTARAGEIARFSITNAAGLPLPNARLTIWDLGEDILPGGAGPAADRQMISNSVQQSFFTGGLVSVDLTITGLTGTARDFPEDQLTNPLGSETRRPGDRTYVLQVDANTTGAASNYLVMGDITLPFTEVSGTQQIIFVDWDGATDVPIASLGVSVDVPPFDVRDFGLDPAFTDQFIDLVMAEMREDLELVRAARDVQGRPLNPHEEDLDNDGNVDSNEDLNGNGRIDTGFSFELLDSRFDADPGVAANVTRVHMGGNSSVAGLGPAVVGVADEVDTGNRRGDNNAFAFTQSVATSSLQQVFPLGLGPSRIPDLALDVADTASHELGHVLGLWHTFVDFDSLGNVDFDNLMDPAAPPLGTVDLAHRFDRFLGSQVALPLPAGDEPYDGVADSIGTLAFVMTGEDTTGPRVLDVSVSPGIILVKFSEALDTSRLDTDSPLPGALTSRRTVVLQRSANPVTPTIPDDEFAGRPGLTGAIDVPLLAINQLQPTTSSFFAAIGTEDFNANRFLDPGEDVNANGRIDPLTDTLVLRLDPTTPVFSPDRYRLILRGVLNDGRPGIVDPNGVLLDGEFDEDIDGDNRLDPNEDIDGDGQLDAGEDSDGDGELDFDEDINGNGRLDRGEFPSGDGLPGGEFVFAFRVANDIRVDADASRDPTRPPATGTPDNPFRTIQQGLDAARFAALASKPVVVQVAPAAVAYRSPDAGADNILRTEDDLGAIVVPAFTNLVLDDDPVNELIESLYVVGGISEDIDGDGVLDCGLDATCGTGDPGDEDTDADAVLDLMRIYRIDANTGDLLDSVPLPFAGRADDGLENGLATDGTTLFFISSARTATEDRNFNGRLDAGEDANANGLLDRPDMIYVLDAATGGFRGAFLAPSEDLDGNGVLDPKEDTNNNGRLDTGEDRNGNGVLDRAEDTNGNGVIDVLAEDINGDGVLDSGEDTNGNGVLDSAANIDGLAVAGSILYAADSASNTVFRIDWPASLVSGTSVVRGRITTPFDFAGGVDFDLATGNLWGVEFVDSAAPESVTIHQFDPVSGSLVTGVDVDLSAVPGGAASVLGIGLVGGRLFASNSDSDEVFEFPTFGCPIPPATTCDPIDALDFLPGAPSALAGTPVRQIVVKLLQGRVDVAGQDAALVAVGTERPVVFTSLRDDEFLGDTNFDFGFSTPEAANWMGIAFRQDSNDFVTAMDNVIVRYAGGPGQIVPGITTTLDPVELFDARPTLHNVEISNSAQSAIGATVDSFERILGRSGPDMTWDLNVGQPVVGDFSPADSKDEFGVYQVEAGVGRWLLDLDGDRAISAGEVLFRFDGAEDSDGDGVLNCGLDGVCGTGDASDEDLNANTILDAAADLPVVGDWCTDDPSTTAVVECPGDEIGVFRTRTAEFFLDLNGDQVFQPGAEGPFRYGLASDRPVAGNFSATSVGDEIGVYRPSTSEFFLDFNGDRALEPKEDLDNDGVLDAGEDRDPDGSGPLLPNGALDNEGPFAVGQSGDLPVVGDWNGNGVASIGAFRPTNGEWRLDINDNHVIATTGEGPFVFGLLGDLPAVGDWCIDNPATPAVECPGDELGVYRPASAAFLLDLGGGLTGAPDRRFQANEDLNGNGRLDTGEDANRNSRLDNEGPFPFGAPNQREVPVVANWDADFGSEIAVFQPRFGLWLLDVNTGTICTANPVLCDHAFNSEDLNRNGVLDPGEDVDPQGVVGPDGVLDSGDGPFVFGAAPRDRIGDFVSNNSINGILIAPGRQTVNDAVWDEVQIPFVLTGTVTIEALPSLSLVPTLELAPGLVVKTQLANLEVNGLGATLLADVDLKAGKPRIIFTSLFDDTVGPGGRPDDTNNDLGAVQPEPGDWGGIVLSGGATAVLNGLDISFAGSLQVPAGFSSVPQNPNPISLFGFDPATGASLPVFATITNNRISNTLNLDPTTRNFSFDVAAIGADGGAIGAGPNLPRIPFNPNPFIRNNDVNGNNGINGLEIRTDLGATILSGDLQLDDTDIVHVALGTIVVASRSSLTLAANPAGTFDVFDGFDPPGVDDGLPESPPEPLILKFGGRGNTRAPMGANPVALTLPNGTVQTVGAGIVVGWDDGGAGTVCPVAVPALPPTDCGFESSVRAFGIPGNEQRFQSPVPIIFTSLRDDLAGIGGSSDTNNDGTNTLPLPADWGSLTVGGLAKNFGRLSPLNGAGLSESVFNTIQVRFATQGILLQSQSPEISSTVIRDASTFGVRAISTFGAADPHIFNSVITRSGTAVSITGPAAPAPASRAMIVNNVLDADAVAVALATRAGALVMNNAITSNTTGVTIDASSLGLADPAAMTRNLFFSNGTDTNAAAANAQPILNRDPLYRSALTLDYRPQPGSPLIDSARSEFGSVFSAFGPVRAPEFDFNGVFRRDDPETSNLGIGAQPYLDIAAFERVVPLFRPPVVTDVDPDPDSALPTGGAPSVIKVTFSQPMRGINGNTFFITGSGGDGTFDDGDEFMVLGTVTVSADRLMATFVPSLPLPNDEAFRITVLEAATNDERTPLDGDFFGTLPSGDSFPGTSFVVFFTVGNIQIPPRGVIFVDNDPRSIDLAACTDPVTGLVVLDGTLRCPFDTIQGGINAASPGFEVRVRPGLFEFDLDGDNILDLGADGLCGTLDRGEEDLNCDGVFSRGEYRENISLRSNITVVATGEDFNRNGVLDLSEDTNRNGVLDPGEDRNGNLVLDLAEDRNGNRAIDPSSTVTIILAGPGDAVTATNIAGGGLGRPGRGFTVIHAAPTGTIPLTNTGFHLINSSTEISSNVVALHARGFLIEGAGGGNSILNNLIVGNLDSGIEIDAQLANPGLPTRIINNTIAFNVDGIELRRGRGGRMATIVNNIIVSNDEAGIRGDATQTAVVEFNDVWGNDLNRNNFERIAAGTPSFSFNPLFVRPVDPRPNLDPQLLSKQNFELQKRDLDNDGVLDPGDFFSPAVDVGDDRRSTPRDFDNFGRIDIGGVGAIIGGRPTVTDLGAFEDPPLPGGPIATASGQRSASAGPVIRRVPPARLAALDAAIQDVLGTATRRPRTEPSEREAGARRSHRNARSSTETLDSVTGGAAVVDQAHGIDSEWPAGFDDIAGSHGSDDWSDDWSAQQVLADLQTDLLMGDGDER